MFEKLSLNPSLPSAPSMVISQVRPKTSILDKSLSKKRGEVSLSCYALLFSELVQYCQNKVHTVPELQNKLCEMGQEVGVKIIDLYFVRERNGKRETKLLNMLLFIKTTLWKGLFGKEADKLEHANDDERIYYIIEKEPLVNKFISVPKDKGSLNCAMFIAGIVEGILNAAGFAVNTASSSANVAVILLPISENHLPKLDQERLPGKHRQHTYSIV